MPGPAGATGGDCGPAARAGGRGRLVGPVRWAALGGDLVPARGQLTGNAPDALELCAETSGTGQSPALAEV